MGKVTKVRSPLKSVALSPEVLTKVNGLRNDGSASFLKKEFAKAAEYYEQAVKLLPEGAAEKAELLQKKVGCLLQLRKFKEAAKDASTVLEIQPSSTAALKARAKAYEQLGFLTKALADVQAVNKTDSATAETREMEARLKDAVSSPKTRPTSAPQQARESTRAAAQRPDQFQITIKVSLGSESRFIYTQTIMSYPELLEQVHAKFPNAGPIVLKYVDKEGDQVTITSRQDIQTAMSDVIAAFQKHIQSMQNKMSMPPYLPPVKINAVPVPSENDVPRAPPAEVAERMNGKAAEVPVQTYEPEDFMMEFARVFTEVTGLDPQAYLEHHNQGHDKLQRAITDTVNADEAEPIFDEVAGHFRDGVVTSFIQWGNVYMMKADKQLQKLLKRGVAAGSPEWSASEELKSAMAFFDQTEAKIKEALKYHADSADGISALAGLEMEKVKAKLGHIIPQLPSEEVANKTPEEHQRYINKIVSDAVAKVPKDTVLKMQAQVDKACQLFEDAYNKSLAIYKVKAAKELERATKEAAKLGMPPPQDNKDDTLPFSSHPSNILVMHGNALYDWSQIMAATGAAPWRPVLDSAAVKFRGSGAPEADVRAALKNHPRAEELDLGPDPEPAGPTTPGSKEGAPAKEAAPAAAPAADKKEAKGLPSLEVRKKATKDEAK